MNKKKLKNQISEGIVDDTIVNVLTVSGEKILKYIPLDISRKAIYTAIASSHPPYN